MQKVNLKKFPPSSGVYLFKDCKNRVIYVGRASVLRKRVASYFANYLTDPRIAQLVNEAKKIDFRKTVNLLEAVILEANLIKKYWPKYNIREKDSRSFIYIAIPKKEWPASNASPTRKASLSDAGGCSDAGWAYPIVIRGQQLNRFPPKETHIFGPFKSYSLAKNLLLLLRKIFPWSTCKLVQERPCFYYQIGLCPGKCVGAINEGEYKKIIHNLILLLKGEKNKVRKILKKANPHKLEFLNRIDDSILITKENNFWENGSPKENHSPHIGRIEGYDISHFAGKETVGSMVVWQNENFDKSQYRLFKIRTAKPSDDLAALEETLSRRLQHKEWPHPNLIMVDGGKTQVRIVEKTLADYKLSIPVVGIAKYNSDRLVFGKMQKPLKDLISLSFPQLLKIRNEAHRFANSLRKKLLKKSYK